MESRRKFQVRGDLFLQIKPGRATRRNHQFGAEIETLTGVVQGIDRGLGLEMKVSSPVRPSEHVLEEVGNLVTARLDHVALVRNPKVFRQRHLTLSQDGVGLGKQFHRAIVLRVGRVSFASNGQ